MQDTNDLKNIVIQGFESKGILSKIRAQIRASVFKVVEEENQTSNNNTDGGLNWENQRAMSLKNTDEGLVICRLFENLLQFYELDYTLNVFVHEVNTAGVPESDNLRSIISEENRCQHK